MARNAIHFYAEGLFGVGFLHKKPLVVIISLLRALSHRFGFLLSSLIESYYFILFLFFFLFFFFFFFFCYAQAHHCGNDPKKRGG